MKKSKSFWRATSIRVIVRNHIYTGRIHFGDDVSDTIEHLRVIDDYLFDQCDSLLEEKAPTTDNNPKCGVKSTSAALLTGIVFCGSCGSRLCLNHNKTKRLMADGTYRVYEQDVYRCYRKFDHSSACTGQANYKADVIENAVLQAVHQYYRNIRSAPTGKMLAAANHHTRESNDRAMAQVGAALRKAQAEMTALEEESIKALTGESTVDRVFLQSLLPKRRAMLEKAKAGVERIRSEINDEENARKEQ